MIDCRKCRGQSQKLFTFQYSLKLFGLLWNIEFFYFVTQKVGV